MNHGGVILDAGGVTFGDNVLVGPQCGFYTSGHPLDAAKRAQGLEYAYPIRVGSGVWIGGGVRVMPGVSIGDRGGHRLRQRGDEGHPCRSPGCGRPLPPHPPHHGGGPDAALIRRSSCPSGKFRPGVGNLCRMCYHGGAAGDASAAVQSNAPPARCLCEQEEAP